MKKNLKKFLLIISLALIVFPSIVFAWEVYHEDSGWGLEMWTRIEALEEENRVLTERLNATERMLTDFQKIMIDIQTMMIAIISFFVN